MTTPNSLPLSPFTTIPHELVIDIFSHLDIVSVFSFLDSSRFHRRLLLSLRPVWTTIVLDPEVKMKVEEIYSTLRRLKYENGLREVVERVIMDGVDDHFSPDPVVMIYKFPNLRYLSATSRRRTTSLMALTQMLRDTLEGGSIPAGSLALRVLRIHHDYMDNKERVEPLAAVLAKLAGERIELDIRECAHKGCKTVVKVKPAVCGGLMATWCDI
ncbi:hypothetical protein BC937DRAFT_89424 [Endogone sp. FLAS-F59071]|nr:hypothetical protein BC937DRAFT_89424 [Endogone sp. FLAS-F59071]|eukprot:RUS17844.1 hypothetical protein BC937DRAFT_89424 [Endogone sp. FLAS-F59071]